MAAITERWLMCDGDGCEANSRDGGMDLPFMNRVRRDCARGGWTFVHPDKDYCPECSKEVE